MGTGGSDLELIRPVEKAAPLANHTVPTNNQDLLDLLGGLDVNPTQPPLDVGLINNLTASNNNSSSAIIFANNHNSNFLIDGITANTHDNHHRKSILFICGHRAPNLYLRFVQRNCRA